MKLAVIPARGGSKRIPRKNIKPFFGKPIIGWSIEAAQQAGCFDRIVVSTDDEEIAEVARTFGAETPFMRPPELANDHAGTTPVVAHAAQWFVDQGVPPELVCCIYATAPFVRAEDILHGLRKIQQGRWDYAFSATLFEAPIQRALKLTADGGVTMFQPEQFMSRSQDLEPAWHDAAQFYWGRSAAWLEHKQIFSGTATVVALPRYRVHDIDTPDDWFCAELMYAAWLARQQPREPS
jgi:N-acylneuraminate cytidylyltransferase